MIIPAYNEETRIEGTVVNYINNLKKRYDTFEILIIINNCTDETLDIVRGLKNRYPKLVRYRNYKKVMGKGGAIIEGMRLGKGSKVGFVDADDAFDISGIMRLIEMLDSHDCVIASKWKGKSFSEVNEPFTRKIFSRMWNFFVKTILGLDFKDTQAGAKFFSRVVIQKIGYDFICKNFAFDVELLKKIKDNNIEISEIYVPSKYLKGSSFKTIYSFRMFIDLIKIRRGRD